MHRSIGPPRAANFSGNLHFTAGTSTQLVDLGYSFIDDIGRASASTTTVLSVGMLAAGGFAAALNGAA